MKAGWVVVVCHCLSVSALAAPENVHGPAWIRNLDEAKQKARESQKDLVIVFTGHGWCASCELLDREVFQRREFIAATEKDYVFVELDFTFSDSDEDRKREEAYRALQKEYLAPGVPTVVLADHRGVPYAFATGYEEGTGPQKALAWAQRARAARAERDRNLEAAQAAAGQDRARFLHQAIESVAMLLGSLEDRGDDPVLVFYRGEIDEIRRLESEFGGRLSAIYEARRKRRDEWITRESVFAQLDEFKKTRDYQGAIDFIADVLERTESPDVQWRLEAARQVYLEWDDQHELALENARRLLPDPQRTAEEREFLLDRESFNLFRLKRIDEGIAQCDRRIHQAEGDPAKRLKLLGWKAQMLLNRVSAADSIKAWREYRHAAKPGTDDWLTATALLARQLQREGDHREALALLSEFLEVQPDPWIMLDAVESHIALGEHNAARELLEKAERLVPSEPERPSDSKHHSRTRDRIADLRSQLVGQ